MSDLLGRRIAVIGALSLAIAACGSGAQEAAETAPTTTTAPVDDTMVMDADEHEHDGSGTEWAGTAVPTVVVGVEGDATSGWTVTAQIGETFVFGSPEDIAHTDGVGHAHLVIDGRVDQMIYEPTVSIDSLAPGMHMIEVRLASSDHSDYLSNGEFISGMVMIEVAGEIDPPDVVFTASFDGEEVTISSERVDVSVGDIVEITISSDVAEEIHVHGYDITTNVAAGGTATVRFTAEVPGIFEVELESSATLVVELVIS